MAGTSIASQLLALKTALNAPEPGRRRPLTRHSILHDAKTAADIDNDTIFGEALSGLEKLITLEERFRNFKNDLFSHQSKELDRESVGDEENTRINASIASFLRLLSGFMESIMSHSALKTLEYLVRRYKVHEYNVEDLILCALPYHDTISFVKIVQLINTGNSKWKLWKFLDAVKESGARLPREDIVQQCIRDMGVLEAICNYAMPVKKMQPSKHVIGFCTAVVFEFLGLVNVDSDIVKRILPYVCSGLQPGAKGTNHKAGALMIVTLLAQKAALAPSVVKSLMHSVADVTKADAKETTDFQWLRMSFMALINIVQLQSVEVIPKKTINILFEIRDIPRILSGLSKEYNIDKFFTVLLDSLLEYSVSDESCHCALLSMIESFPMKRYVNRIVSKLLTMRMKIYNGKVDVVSPESGSKGKQILVSICEKYPNESCQAFFSFMKDAKMQPKKVSSSYEILCKILDENLESSNEMPNPKYLFAMEHSEAGIRKSAVLALDVADILREKVAGSKKFDAIQDAIQQRLYDDDLNVVLAVLQLKNLTELLNPSVIAEALQNVLQRCTDILLSGSSTKAPQSSDAALLCLRQVIKAFKNQEKYATTLAAAVFPLILIRRKTRRLNLEVLEMAKELNWPLFENLITFPVSDKKLENEEISSKNMKNIDKLADTFSSEPKNHLPWLVKCCESQDLSKTLFFFVLLSLELVKMDSAQFYEFIDSINPILQRECDNLESTGLSQKQSYEKILEGDCKGILLHETNIRDLNCQLAADLFLKLLEALIATTPKDISLDMSEKWESTLQDLFVFFSSHSADAFNNHLKYFCTERKISLTPMMMKLFTEEGTRHSVQVESLCCFSNLCPQLDGDQLDSDLAFKLLEEFPSILVPLTSDNQDVRVAAMGCVKELSALSARVDIVGNIGERFRFNIGELLRLIVQQQKMIISDNNVLASFFTTLLGSSPDSLLMQQSIGKRFAESTKSEILSFMLVYALGLSAHAKLKILSLVKGLGSEILSVAGVTSLLNDLLEKRHRYHVVNGISCERLSKIEVDLLCLLLESCTKLTPSGEGQAVEEFILKALLVNGVEDSAIQEPCLTVMRNLSGSFYGKMKTETQESIFRKLLVLFRSSNGDIQNAARDALLRIDINCSIIGRVIDSILEQKACSVGSGHEKKRQKSIKSQNQPIFSRCLLYYDATQNMENTPSFLGAFLDTLLMKKNIENRILLVGPLFKLLRLIFTSDRWILEDSNQDKARTASDSTAYMKQTLLSTLENISASIINDIPQKDVLPDFDMHLLVDCVRRSSEAVTRNHVFSLITTLAKIVPGKVLEHILDILTAIGESTVTQWDTYSQRVSEDLISTILPHWLHKTGNIGQILQIFVNILLQVAGHRRLSIISPLLRGGGEAESLGSLLFLLFHSLISTEDFSSFYVHEPNLDRLAGFIHKQWEFEFAVQLFEQCSCTIWLRSLTKALQEIGKKDLSKECFLEMLVAMQFVSDKLGDPEIAYRLESGEDLDQIQTMICDLMEQVVTHLRLLDLKKHVEFPAGMKNELKEYTLSVIKTITKCLLPSTYFEVITKLTGRAKDKNVRKKALGLLCETVKDFGTHGKVEKRGSVASLANSWLHLDETSLQSFKKLCQEIVELLNDDDVDTPLQLAAVSAIEVLADKFASNDGVFITCLRSVCGRISSDNSILSCHCLRAAGSLINALGTGTLPELSNIMEHVRRRTRDSPTPSASLFTSVLVTLEAVVNKLGGFLNPYLGDILSLVVLHASSFSLSDEKVTLKADAVRKLIITGKIPVRLLIPPILEMYSEVVKYGETSLSILFEMLGNLVGSMDKSSVGVYHAKIFDLCLLALDLRRQGPTWIENIDVVEQNVIKAAVGLSMKLTDSMFRPLFIKTIEWSSPNVEDDEGKAYRAISFYNLVNIISESHRSLFVPYFKYLLDGIVQGLAEAEDANIVVTPKKKNAKHNKNSTKDRLSALSIQLWHIRALVLSSLHKCFLYDTATLKFLDPTNFQVLLKPIVSQLVFDPPTSIENNKNVPSVRQVDDLLVNCVSQMAVTAGSDLLWKPLNHEVLMQTRSEKVRARIVGLRIIKQLVEKLKEEYLQFLPETIPFLGELLEDSELSVKTLAQDILKEMENMSGESLKEYL